MTTDSKRKPNGHSRLSPASHNQQPGFKDQQNGYDNNAESTSPHVPVAKEDTRPPRTNGIGFLGDINGTKRDAKISRPQVLRKLSSPMMPSFMVSAPGKVIVFGEHAVVHGKVSFAPRVTLDSRTDDNLIGSDCGGYLTTVILTRYIVV